ncbi:hypothetical protein CN307_31525 [Bacillus cereus]|uniref:Uncharacterized protein n=1 Tax=Bacillus cereus TaxID=1396 RepID=A0A2A8ZQR8_BACCE|nr:hypothetical protein CN307_31525 [Bacillus cereus]
MQYCILKQLFIDAIISLLNDCYIFLWFLSNTIPSLHHCTRNKRHLNRCLLLLYDNNTIKLRWFKSEEGTLGCLFFISQYKNSKNMLLF